MMTTVFTLATTVVSLAGAPVSFQDPGLDPVAVAAIYHQLTGETLDVRAIAERSDALRGVSTFDRPEVIAAEVSRLESLLAAADPSQEFVTRVNDNISEYDHDRSEFTITLFSPGYYVPLQAFGQQYQVAFANADAMKTIPMPKDEAREFDTMLNRTYRSVITEVRFKVTGQGDPTGAVTGQRVVRAEILSARVLDRQDNVLFTPTVAAAVVADARPFDATKMDVAGFRVGVKAKELERSLTRLIGPVSRGTPSKGAFSEVVATMTANEMGCSSYPGQRTRSEPGAFCVTAFLDQDDIVRVIRVERLFPGFNGETFRSALTDRYGPVTEARGGGSSYILAWGDPVDASLLYRPGSGRALSAYYEQDSDFMSRGLNSIPRIRVILQLVDAAWASRATK